MTVRVVDDFRDGCKSACKIDCFACGCPHAGAGDCARFYNLLDFEFDTSTRRKEKWKIKKIKRKIVNEGDISKVSFDVELSRGDMALITNALNWSKDSSMFRMMPISYKSKHNKILDIFVDEIDKSRTL